ncbi:MAG: GHKL domain-containing protein [Eubacterium sp.]|nr:GHKL domain-containing protein [Eubacterium sp.]
MEQIRGQQHKFSNQIDVIYAMHHLYTDYDELVKKQQEQAGVLRRALMPNDVVILNNPIVIVHVYQKINEILERSILLHSSFSCSLCGAAIPDLQLVNVIGTLLDNAMEALEQKVGNRDMYFRIAEGKERNTVVIEVGNAHEYIPVSQWKRFFERGYSHKGENRGIGLAELKRIVTRYKGNIFVENKRMEEENIFFISVSLNVK